MLCDPNGACQPISPCHTLDGGGFLKIHNPCCYQINNICCYHRQFFPVAVKKKHSCLSPWSERGWILSGDEDRIQAYDKFGDQSPAPCQGARESESTGFSPLTKNSAYQRSCFCPDRSIMVCIIVILGPKRIGHPYLAEKL